MPTKTDSVAASTGYFTRFRIPCTKELWPIVQVYSHLQSDVTILFKELGSVSSGKSGREISWKIWGFETSRFPGNLCRDPGKFFYISKDFSGTDIYHFDIKNALLQI